MPVNPSNDICVIHLDNPPVNALSWSLRKAILDQLAAANADTSVRAVVIAGADKVFSAGADIAEFGTDLSIRWPGLRDLIVAIEHSAKPVVAAITGTCLGGGLELVLGCHARVAHPDARIGLPETTLGLLPGAGGTQRLPRAIAPERAVGMILSGRIEPARNFAGTGLFHAIGPDAPGLAAELARALASLDAESRLLRHAPVDSGAVATSLSALDKSAMRESHLGIVEALTALATLPFDAALQREADIFTRLENSPDAKALRHAFFAERQAGRMQGPRVEPRAIAAVGVVGSGTMGRGIAIAALKAGYSVILSDTSEAALRAAKEMIEATLARDVSKGRLTETQLSALSVRIGYTTDLAAFSDADLVIEAIYENMQAKLDLLAQLGPITKPGCIVASNTSMLDIDELAAHTANPSQVLGLHFFSPAHVMKLLEVVNARHTAPDVLAAALSFARRLGKIPVIAGVTHGFIGNRALEAYLDRAFRMVEEGVSPYEIDAALEDWGMAMGPFRMLDLAGLDVCNSVRRTRRQMWPDRDIPDLDEVMPRLGRKGQKTGGGWYDYDADTPRGRPCDGIEAILGDYRAKHPRPPKTCDRQAIVDTLVGSLAREGLAIVAEGHAQSAGDVDVVFLNGYGFPRFRGGPVFYAKQARLI